MNTIACFGYQTVFKCNLLIVGIDVLLRLDSGTTNEAMDDHTLDKHDIFLGGGDWLGLLLRTSPGSALTNMHIRNMIVYEKIVRFTFDLESTSPLPVTALRLCRLELMLPDCEPTDMRDAETRPDPGVSVRLVKTSPSALPRLGLSKERNSFDC